MRKIKEVLRLHFEAGLSERQISKICVLGKGTVRRFLQRAEAAGLSWPLPSLDDAALERQLFPPPPPPSAGQRPQPDYAAIHKELKGPNVTLQLLWEEYKQEHPDGYSYSRFSELYGEWSRRLDLVMRQDHRAGEKMFVDHAGQTVPVIDSLTGETRDAYVSRFVRKGLAFENGPRHTANRHAKRHFFALWDVQVLSGQPSSRA
jgi:hypothetical protein